jgi:PAS domain S-box-containing protein
VQEEIFKMIIENMEDIAHVWLISENRFIYFSPAIERVHGFTREEALGLHWKELIAPESMADHIKYTGARYIQAAQNNFLKKSILPEYNEYMGLRKDGSRIWLEENIFYLCGENGKPTHSIGISRDISSRKQAAAQLESKYTHMQDMVREQSGQLSELSTTVKVLLEQQESFKKSYRKDLGSFIAGMVMPFVEKLKQSGLNKHQLSMIERIEFSLNDAVTPIARKLTSGVSALSPTALQVAMFIKEGKSTKEIAEIMNLSPKTVEFHREKIREKFGIKNQKANLRSILNSME